MSIMLKNSRQQLISGNLVICVYIRRGLAVLLMRGLNTLADFKNTQITQQSSTTQINFPNLFSFNPLESVLSFQIIPPCTLHGVDTMLTLSQSLARIKKL